MCLAQHAVQKLDASQNVYRKLRSVQEGMENNVGYNMETGNEQLSLDNKGYKYSNEYKLKTIRNVTGTPYHVCK